ncbi:hypothetical protein PENDEC_c002G02087 [Penicillium decumbens]|uniref:Reverse transcriptase domain-containing protein n=1 Tax=Penicillium decumbens TaxID=69771 RepID=A0A1V6PLP4_PENDC|nr:hypothetical protein PENDEC_c002G02087 [Penicillium decumbens]
MIDGRMQRRLPMLIADLGKHDLILGREWFAEYKVLPDCSKRRLIWPEEQSLQDEVASQLSTILPRTILRRPDPNSDHQRDADRRDRLFEKVDRPPRYEPTRTVAEDRKGALAKMERALQGETPPNPPTPKERWAQKTYIPASNTIAMIGGVGFYRQAKKEGSEVFLISLEEIDRILENKRYERQSEERETKRVVPKHYDDYTDVFSKQDSDTMPPHREFVDHKIILEEGITPRYCPLYKQSEEELQAAKAYITENLVKGFIMESKAPFASPILMARKPDGGLRLCVDFRKLNSITKKDRYPIPLVDEIF